MKYRYLVGASTARMGDESSGPALLLLGFAVTRSAGAGSALLAGLTIAAAAGGPLFGAALDGSRRPERILAGALAAYALGIGAIQVSMGKLPLLLVVCLAVVTGLSGPAVAGGWTSQLPRVVSGDALARFSALDALTFDVASLAGPALAAVIAAWLGARPAVAVSATLVALAVPAACSLAPAPVSGAAEKPLRRQLAEGFTIIIQRRALLRATATSVVSYLGIGMLLVCCPVLGQQRLGGASRGALLISAAAVAAVISNVVLARRPPRRPDALVLASTLLLSLSLGAAAVTPGWLTMLAVGSSGVGQGPQLTGLLAVRHRESPAAVRGQVFTTAASLKIGGLAAGTALAGPLAGRSAITCLLAAAGIQVVAAAVYLAIRTDPVSRNPATCGGR
ncbi:MAG: MFS transporter [Nocardiopsaceae bacterium]|nr:MFS transporter [Nocardiopsaceae bacterium]